MLAVIGIGSSLRDMMKDRHNKPQEEPWKKEDNWQSIAMAILICGLAVLPFVTWWVLTAPPQSEVTKDGAILTRVQIAGAFGALYLAALTFSVAIWRGSIARRQADQQLEQIRTLSAQVASTEENNLALLLQKGAELIAATELERVSAGIASLQAVASADIDKYSGAAMDQLAGYVGRNSSQGHQVVQTKDAIQALRETSRTTGRMSGREVLCELEAGMIKDWSTQWEIIEGCKFVIYVDGVVRHCNISEIGNVYSMSFKDVTFEHSTIVSRKYFSFFTCRYENCEIVSLTGSDIRGSYFDDCDFSNAEIRYFDISDEVERLRGNYFHEGHEPIFKSYIEGDEYSGDLTEIFEVKPGKPTGPVPF